MPTRREFFAFVAGALTLRFLPRRAVPVQSFAVLYGGRRAGKSDPIIHIYRDGITLDGKTYETLQAAFDAIPRRV